MSHPSKQTFLLIDAVRAKSLGLSLKDSLYQSQSERTYGCLTVDSHEARTLFIRQYDVNSLDLAQHYIQNHVQGDSFLSLERHQEFPNEDGSRDLMLVMESYSLTLQEDILRRRRHQNPYEEYYVYMQGRTLIQALANLQAQNIAHRNISPVSLYFTSGGLKLGDIALPNFDAVNSKLECSSAYYLSPETRSALQRKSRLLPNPYKSGVFSLGVCLLSMCLCRKPRFEDANTLSQMISQEIAECQVSEAMKNILSKMLTCDEKARLDFAGLGQFLETSHSIEQIPHSADVTCLRCAEKVVLGEGEGKAIVLPCDTSKRHVYCSTRCFIVFASDVSQDFSEALEVLRCPSCQVSLDLGFTLTALGGNEEYERLRRERNRCTDCRVNPGTVTITCRHSYCSDCLAQMIVYDAPLECSVCRVKWGLEEVKAKVPIMSRWWCRLGL